MSGPYVPAVGDLVRLAGGLPVDPYRILGIDNHDVPGWVWVDGYHCGASGRQYPGRYETPTMRISPLDDPLWDRPELPLPPNGAVLLVSPGALVAQPGAGRFRAILVRRAPAGDATLVGWWMRDPALEVRVIRVHLAGVTVERKVARCTS